MNAAIQFSYWYKTALFRSLRLLIFFSLLFVIISSLQQKIFPNLVVSLLLFFITFEITFRFKIARIWPHVVLSVNDGKNVYLSFTKKALTGFVLASQTSRILLPLLKITEGKSFLGKIGIAQETLMLIDIDKQVLAQKAFEIAKQVPGKYVTVFDVLAAYLLLTEEKTKLLFSKQLHEKELLEILLWLRITNPSEETQHSVRLPVSGSGFGEALLTGWTPETLKYTEDITVKALQTRPFIIGREQEFQKIIESLSRSQNNNVLLVGEAGSGKDTLVQALATKSFSGELPEKLNRKRIMQLMIGQLIAGIASKSDLEVRLEAIIEEVIHAGNVILEISELQNVLGSSTFDVNLAGALQPYLKDGKIPIIATLTAGNYKLYLERNPLVDVFEVITLPEPSEEVVKKMLFERTQEIEKKEKVFITYRALVTAIMDAKRYMQDATLPGSAVVLLSDTAHIVALQSKRFVEEADVTQVIEEKTHSIIAAPNDAEKQLLLHLEDKIHQRIIGQQEAVQSIAEGMRRLRSGFETGQRPISFLFLGPTGVGKTETAKALADLYYRDKDTMLRFDMSEYSGPDGVRRLLGAGPGEGEERGELTEKIHDHPASLILLDEFEKANLQIHNLFLQVLDDGRITDNKGKTISLINNIIIATSNAGSEFICEAITKGAPLDENFQKQLLNVLETNQLFKPELLNRFDAVITFKPLGEQEILSVIELMLKELTKKLVDQDIMVTFKSSLVTKIAREGFDKELGARPIRRYIQDHIEDLIAKKKLSNEVKRGDSIVVSVDNSGMIILQIS